MRFIKNYNFLSMKEWHRAEKRIFNILNDLEFDKLADLCLYRGINIENLNKKQIIKAFMISMDNQVSGEYFTKL